MHNKIILLPVSAFPLFPLLSGRWRSGLAALGRNLGGARTFRAVTILFSPQFLDYNPSLMVWHNLVKALRFGNHPAAAFDLCL